MEIIALIESSSRGKSETLNIVYQYLLLFGYTQVPGHFRSLGNPNHKDFIDIVEKKSMKIGIVTLGDFQKYLKDVGPGDIVQDLLLYLQTNGCSKAICACNSNLNIAISFINAFSHVFLNKTVTNLPAEQRLRNGEDAERIYRLI